MEWAGGQVPPAGEYLRGAGTGQVHVVPDVHHLRGGKRSSRLARGGGQVEEEPAGGEGGPMDGQP